MSCYFDGDLIAYRLPKRRAKGYTVYMATVAGDQETDHAVKVHNSALGREDLVPVESIVMHQLAMSA